MSTDRINEQLAPSNAASKTRRSLRVFDGLPLGSRRLSPRCAAVTRPASAVLDVLLTVIVLPVGKGGHALNPNGYR